MRVAPICPECGSRDIAQVGCDARWNVSRQEWLPGQPEGYACDDCGDFFDAPREIEIEDEKGTA